MRARSTRDYQLDNMTKKQLQDILKEAQRTSHGQVLAEQSREIRAAIRRKGKK